MARKYLHKSIAEQCNVQNLGQRINGDVVVSDNFQQSAPENLETAYDNSGRVENASQLVSDYISDAADYRHQMANFIEFGQVYGKRERNQLDLFWPDKNKDAPLVMFIHGGYWQRLDRSAFSHMAKGLNARGVAVAIPSYTLCPDINISGIIDEIRRACIILWKTYDRPITVVGHSAGGHLAACMLATKWNRIHSVLPEQLVQSALSISGVFELAPLMKTTINDALKLTPDEARTASPYNWMIEPGLRFDAWVGGEESSEFQRQSRSQAQRWRMMGAVTRYHEIAGANHFTAIHPLTDPNSEMVMRILELMKPAELPTLESLNIPEHNPLPVDERKAVVESKDAPTPDDQEKKAVVESKDAPTPDDQEKQEEPATGQSKRDHPQKAEPEQNPPEPDVQETETADDGPSDTAKPENIDIVEENAPPTDKEPIQKSTVGMTSPIGMMQAKARPAKKQETIPQDEPPQEKAVDEAPPESDDAALDDALAAAFKNEDSETPEKKTKEKSKPETKVTEETSAQDSEDKNAADNTPEPQPEPQEESADSESTASSDHVADDLTIISGIGDVIHARLNDLGFTTFEQMADLSEPQKEMIEEVLDFKGRIDREHWITQARHQKAIKELAASD